MTEGTYTGNFTISNLRKDEKMSNDALRDIAGGEPAFPCAAGTDGKEYLQKGMTLRDWFAGQALQSLISKSPFWDTEGEHGAEITQEELNQFMAEMASSAYFYADAMIAEREKFNGSEEA